MPRYELIRQDVRRETAHGSEGDRLLQELIRLRDRVMSGDLTPSERRDELALMRRRSHELREWLRGRGLDKLAWYVGRETKSYVDGGATGGDPLPEDFDYTGGL